jgi:hypothetical protein
MSVGASEFGGGGGVGPGHGLMGLTGVGGVDQSPMGRGMGLGNG